MAWAPETKGMSLSSIATVPRDQEAPTTVTVTGKP